MFYKSGINEFRKSFYNIKKHRNLLQRFPDSKETSNEKRSEFIDENGDLLYYILHKISLRKRRSYIESSEWLKNELATINQKKKKDNCFQFAITVTLNHENIRRNPQRISKIRPFINQYNWKDVHFPSQQKDWEKF